MLTMKKTVFAAALALTGVMATQQAFAAIALDRTRVVYNGDEKSISLNISNENKNLPYLAQAWIEDAQGNKITSPLTVLPPVQRVEAGAKSQVKVQAAPAAASLPQDKETLFYFNLREIPPRSNKPNTLQIALHTRIKLFYRPTGLPGAPAEAPKQLKWQIASEQGHAVLRADNPTPYYVSFNGATYTSGGKRYDVDATMVAPFSKAAFTVKGLQSASAGKLEFQSINDYGGIIAGSASL